MIMGTSADFAGSLPCAADGAEERANMMGRNMVSGRRDIGDLLSGYK
jgi:hypothetical protein